MFVRSGQDPVRNDVQPFRPETNLTDITVAVVEDERIELHHGMILSVSEGGVHRSRSSKPPSKNRAVHAVRPVGRWAKRAGAATEIAYGNREPGELVRAVRRSP